MNDPSFTYLGFVAIGHPDVLPNGKINGNFVIHADNPLGEVVHRTERMVDCESPEQALENMCIAAEVWIEAHVAGSKPTTSQ